VDVIERSRIQKIIEFQHDQHVPERPARAFPGTVGFDRLAVAARQQIADGREAVFALKGGSWTLRNVVAEGVDDLVHGNVPRRGDMPGILA
jgi:hypothetical protein